jgi:hypothetical protein
VPETLVLRDADFQFHLLDSVQENQITIPEDYHVYMPKLSIPFIGFLGAQTISTTQARRLSFQFHLLDSASLKIVGSGIDPQTIFQFHLLDSPVGIW